MKQPFWKFTWLICLALSPAMMVRPTTAQETAAADKSTEPNRVPESIELLFKEIDEDSLHDAPQREFKTETGAAQQTRLFRADPKLLENKFGATLVLLPSGLNPADEDSIQRHEKLRYIDNSWSRKFPATLQRLAEFDNVFLFSPDVFQARHSGTESTPITKLGQYHALLVEQCPPDQRPESRLTDFLTSPDCDRDVMRRSNLRQPGMRLRHAEWTYTVFAPTAEEAQARAGAIIRLYDCGLSRPMQRYLLTEGRKSLESARMGYQELARQDQAIRAAEEQAANPTEITAEIFSQLKSQKVLLAVELAGLDARIKACNAMLKDDVRVVVTHIRESINDMKVKAEVDLAGTKEKLDRINGFIAEANESYALQSRIAQLKAARQTLQSQIKKDESRAEAYARLVSLYAPLQLKDEKITISPVEWTN